MKDNKYVVLYVDDDQDMLDSLRFILEKNNYIMEEAVTGEKGVAKYKECNPDLVIVDLMMEEVDSGVNCVKELKLLGNKAPIYMLSSVGDNLNETISFSELGLSGIFQKPIEPQMLLKTLKAKLG
ncbi:MAG TPA: response regulator [Victivallales bacterium]|nr:response regulator [Victivallales bacterium]